MNSPRVHCPRSYSPKVDKYAETMHISPKLLVLLLVHDFGPVIDKGKGTGTGVRRVDASLSYVYFDASSFPSSHVSFYIPPRVLGFGFHLTFHLTPSVHIPIFRSPHTTSTWGRLFLSLDSFVIDRSTIFPRGYRLSLFIAIAIAVVVPLISNLERRLRINKSII